jgi:hypothetical protein
MDKPHSTGRARSSAVTAGFLWGRQWSCGELPNNERADSRPIATQAVKEGVLERRSKHFCKNTKFSGPDRESRKSPGLARHPKSKKPGLISPAF